MVKFSKIYDIDSPVLVTWLSIFFFFCWSHFHFNILCFVFSTLYLGNNCIQNFHLERYIVVNTVRKFSFTVTQSGAVKRDFRTYIRRYTSPNENFEYSYPHFNAQLTVSLQKDSENVLRCGYTSSGCQLHKTACQLHIFTCKPMKSDVT